MQNSQPLKSESSAVQAHLKMVQDVIARMAENGRACKLWCVTLVAATLVLVARTGEPTNALLALVPTGILFFLDSYYLALERAFRKSYNAFVSKLHGSESGAHDLYVIQPTGMNIGLVWSSARSTSIAIFYPFVTMTVIIAWLVILPAS